MSDSGRHFAKALACGLLSWSLLGLSGGEFVGFWITRLNDIPPLSADGLIIAVWMACCYAAVLAAAGLACSTLGAAVWLAMPPPWARCRYIAVVHATLAALLSAFVVRRFLWTGSTSPLRPVPTPVLAAFTVGSGVAALLALLSRLPRAQAAAALAAVVAGAPVLGAVIRRPEASPSRTEPAREAPPSSAQAGGKRARVLVIGFDGLDPEILTTLMARGELPHFKGLIARGAWGRAATLLPTFSPIIWTTVATGKLPAKHGILAFGTYALRGVSRPIQRLPIYVGSERVFEWLRGHGVSRMVPVASTIRRTKALWNILSDAGYHVGFLNWWATWPAERVNGVIVSDRYFQVLTDPGRAEDEAELVFPPAIRGDLDPLVVRPAEVSRAQLTRFFEPADGDIGDRRIETSVRQFHAADLTYTRISQRLLSRARYDLFAVYLKGVDGLSHFTGKYSALFPAHVLDKQREARYGGSLAEYYRYADDQLAGLLTFADADTDVVVCSDHGFEWQPEGRFAHEHAPAGVFILAGPDAAAGKELSGIRVTDYGPTVLYLAGLAIADDMDGKVLVDAIRSDRLAARPVSHIPTYETAPRRPRVPGGVDDSGLRERLRALGYVH